MKQFISKMMFFVMLAMLLSPLSLSAGTTNPSFDCTKAESESEKMVCSDPQLARLDRELNRVYMLAYNNSALDKTGKRYLRAGQVGWIKGRDETWKVEDKQRYVKELYVFRIIEILKKYPASRAADSEGISSGPTTYDCSGEVLEAYYVQSDPPMAMIYFKNHPYVPLYRVPSASGAKYAVEDYHGISMEFWAKGKEALFTTFEGQTLQCREVESADAPEKSASLDSASFPDIENYPLLKNANALLMGRVIETMRADCPGGAAGRKFPLAEPEYNSKRKRSLEAFQSALSDFTPKRAAEMDTLLQGKSILDLQSLMDSGKLSSKELIIYYVDRIKRYDIDKLNSVMELNQDALAIATALDKERTSGKTRSAMHGIPVLLKDNIATGDQMHTTAGAAALKDWVADRDAFLVKQIRTAGAIILGKANLSEWENYMDPCIPNGFSALGGQVRHPYGPFDPLGSSTGSAVSVAANLTTVSVGSETSGSLIQPARVNSLAVLRPSQGLVSRDYVIPLGSHLDTPGPMGRTLNDVAVLLNAMIGVDAGDPKTSDASALANTDFTQFFSLEKAKQLKVGVILFEQIIAAGKTAMEKKTGDPMSEEDLNSLIPLVVEGNPYTAIQALKAQGIKVVEIKQADLPKDVDTAQPQLLYGFHADLNAFFKGLSKSAPMTTTKEVVEFNQKDMANRAPYNHRYVEWSVKSEQTAEEYVRLVGEAQSYARAWMKAILTKYDVDVVVTAISYANNAGAAGIPALTIPTGLDVTGKPTGLILSGDYLSDPKLFAIGFALEQAIHGRVEPNLEKVLTIV
ncbi:MAG: amidase family protein [Thermodesulfobacteriota bacterium]|nr:amidase family protein [Thermodesulfobacteriota bacterium]